MNCNSISKRLIYLYKSYKEIKYDEKWANHVNAKDAQLYKISMEL